LRRIFNSPGLLALAFLSTMLVASGAYSLAEGEGFVNSLYWSIVTATTLGYGDFSPHSTEGKLITSLLIMFTVFIMIPATTANIASWLIVNRDAFTHEEQEDIKQTLNELRALLRSQQAAAGTGVSER
jgi:voltage-gated potassium channel